MAKRPAIHNHIASAQSRARNHLASAQSRERDQLESAQSHERDLEAALHDLHPQVELKARIRAALALELVQNPFRLVTAEQIACVLGRSINFVLAIKKAGAPFPGNISRPEWVLKWLEANPNFSVKEHERQPLRMLKKTARE